MVAVALQDVRRRSPQARAGLCFAGQRSWFSQFIRSPQAGVLINRPEALEWFTEKTELQLILLKLE